HLPLLQSQLCLRVLHSFPTRRSSDLGPSVKDKELYEKLRDDGNSKEKSARIANAAAKQGRSEVGSKGGESGSYEDWTVDDLRSRDRKSTRLNSSHVKIAYAVFCLKKK